MYSCILSFKVLQYFYTISYHSILYIVYAAPNFISPLQIENVREISGHVLHRWQSGIVYFYIKFSCWYGLSADSVYTLQDNIMDEYQVHTKRRLFGDDNRRWFVKLVLKLELCGICVNLSYLACFKLLMLFRLYRKVCPNKIFEVFERIELFNSLTL